jgi:DNA helicase-2/ATP-dependent DNA helicase PcrA
MMRGSDLHEQAARADVYNSPGWKRLQANQGRYGMRQPSEAKGITIDAEAVSAFSTGDRVFHQKFGYGTVDQRRGRQAGRDVRQSRGKARGWPVSRAADAAGDVPF